MPNLDVTEVLSDPDFVDTFTVVSTTRVIGSDGNATSTAGSPRTGYGVVIPGKSSLRRLDDGSRVEAFIDVYTTFSLTQGVKSTDTSSTAADVITWRGRRYTVAQVENWTGFGAGFVHASCDLLDLNPAA